ncbi:MAG: autotransporter domain-containing esterase [Pseudomonas sp.]|nr:autotransporter domain-containing esterase [Pseudomonas sp.]
MFKPYKALAAAIALASLPLTSSAMPYSQFIVFGDSLSDSGQIPDAGSPLLGGNPTGGIRFTNRTGPTYRGGNTGGSNTEYFDEVSTQRLATHLGLQALPSTPGLPQVLTGNPDGTNWARGGYTTAEILASATQVNGSVTPRGANPPRVRNGYLVDMPRVDPNALFYINGGGNDVLGILTGTPFDAADSAGNLVDLVAALQRAGARTIIVSDLPDVGMTPLGALVDAGNPGLRAVLSNATNQLNVELDSQLSRLGGNVIRLNIRGLFTEVQSDLAAFGFAPTVNQTDVCFNRINVTDGNVGCFEDPTWGLDGTSPDPAKLLFNDGVHPTAAVQQITADYIYSILSAPWEVSLLPEMALSSLIGHQLQLNSQLQGQWQANGQWRSFVSANGMRREFARNAAVAEGDSDALGLTLGGSYRLNDQWRVGLALGLQSQQLETQSDSEYDLSSYLLSGFAQFQQDRLWANGSASVGHLDYQDLERQFALGIAERAEKGDSEGQLYALSARIGYDLANAGTDWQVSPFISADYARVDVDGYSENGNRSTALNFADQQRDSQRLGVGLQLSHQLTPSTQLFAEVSREREFKDDPQQLRMGLNSVANNSFELQGYTPQNGQTSATFGVNHRVGSELGLSASYNFRGTEDRQHGLNLSLSWDL